MRPKLIRIAHRMLGSVAATVPEGLVRELLDARNGTLLTRS
jgi:hypothetical protein